MGPNGSGKSTLAHALMGRPGTEVTAGSITHGRAGADRAAGLAAGPCRPVPRAAAPGRGARRQPALVAGGSGRRGRHRAGRPARRSHAGGGQGGRPRPSALAPAAQRRPLGWRAQAHRDGAARRAATRRVHSRRGGLGARRRRARRGGAPPAARNDGVGRGPPRHHALQPVPGAARGGPGACHGRRPHRCHGRCSPGACSSNRPGTAATRTLAEQRNATGAQHRACPHAPPAANRAIARLVPLHRHGERSSDGRRVGSLLPEDVRAGARTRRGLPHSAARCARGSEPGSVANESGLRSLGARIDAAGARPKRTLRRSGAPKWSRGKKTVVALLSVVVLLVAVVGGGYAYLWYRFDQIDKIHVAAEVAAERRSLHHVGHRLGHTRRRVQLGGPGVRVRVAGHRATQRRGAAVAGDAVDQTDTDRLHPPRHGRHHAPARQRAVRHLQPDQLVLQLGRQPAGQDHHGQLRHPDQPRRPGRLRRLPGLRRTRWAASTSTSPTRPRTPTRA